MMKLGLFSEMTFDETETLEDVISYFVPAWARGEYFCAKQGIEEQMLKTPIADPRAFDAARLVACQGEVCMQINHDEESAHYVDGPIWQRVAQSVAQQMSSTSLSRKLNTT